MFTLMAGQSPKVREVRFLSGRMPSEDGKTNCPRTEFIRQQPLDEETKIIFG
jgi:hypothetical protein